MSLFASAEMTLETESCLPSNRQFCFQAGFVGTSKTRQRPSAPRGHVYMRTSESTSWLGSGNCHCIVITDGRGTRLWTSSVAQITVDARTGQVTAPSPEEFAERTNLLILEGAERLSALVAFTRKFGAPIQLLSERTARTETDQN